MLNVNQKGISKSKWMQRSVFDKQVQYRIKINSLYKKSVLVHKEQFEYMLGTTRAK